MTTIAISGSRSGIGAATAAALSALGHRLIGIDLRDADVCADLSDPAGRAAAVQAVLERCGGLLDGLVLCAGLGSHVEPAVKIAEVNYFGAVELLDGLLPALRRGSSPNAVVVSSVASSQLPWDRNPLGAAFEAGDHAAVQAVCEGAGAKAGHLAYAGSKNALTVAVRRRVVAWGQATTRRRTATVSAFLEPA